MASQPLELILARNLISGIALASFLVDPEGVLVFFNGAAGDLIGRRFEEVGRLRREEWSEFGPFDEFGKLMPTDDMPLTTALRKGLPAHDRFRISSSGGDELIEVDVSALPLGSADGFKGAIVVFWRTSESGEANR